MMYLKILEKQVEANPKISRWEKIIKIKAKIKEIQTKIYKESMKQKVGSAK
jgi:hypothetical protein